MNRMKELKIFPLLLCLVLSLTACQKDTPASGEAENEASTPKVKIVSMVVLGDNLMHMPVVNDGKKADGSQDYSGIFSQLTEDIKGADIAVIGQETVLGGEDLGLSGYPLFNSPYEVGDAMIDAGFNLVSLATNHTVDRGKQAVLNSGEYWNKQ